MASAARAARRLCCGRRPSARAQACASLSTVRMPLPSASWRSTREIHQAARRFVRHDFEMIGLALDHAAERDHAVIGRALLRCAASTRHGDGRRNFQRARHRDAVVVRAGLVEHARGAAQAARRQYARRSALPRSACAACRAFSRRLSFWPCSQISLLSRVVASARAREQGFYFVLHQPRRVARHGVDFEIDVVALAQRAERRHAQACAG